MRDALRRRPARPAVWVIDLIGLPPRISREYGTPNAAGRLVDREGAR
jgi:hypothetical protein